MKCRRQYPGGTEGLLVPGGGRKFGTCNRKAIRFFALLEEKYKSLENNYRIIYVTCKEHSQDSGLIPFHIREIDQDEAEIFYIMES